MKGISGCSFFLNQKADFWQKMVSVGVGLGVALAVLNHKNIELMKRKINMALALVFSASLFVFGQKQTVVSGIVEDEQTGEPIAFATILLANGSGAITDLDGIFP